MTKPRPKAHRRWLPLFMEFIGKLSIDSKETGTGPLVPYGAQTRFLEEICKGLEQGQRFFVCLKARQLGMSTISLAIDLFWLFVHPGMQGALITDSEDNKEIFRNTIERYLESIPEGYKVSVKKHNRTMLSLSNGSVLQYLVAGTRGKKSLGTSRGLNFVHATEVAKWSPDVGIDSLMASLAETHPNRLYIFESTANGFNHYRNMWTGAKSDAHTQRAFFIGWWAKEIYSIPKADPRFAEYMADAATPEEQEKAALVNDAYGFRVTAEQLAWYRWREATRSHEEGSMAQEYPWHEEEAFIVTGTHYFPARRLTEDLRRVLGREDARDLFRAYRYRLGDQFTATNMDRVEVEQVLRSGEAHLRMWDEPKPHGEYVLGVDPAYGRTDWGDRHSISVWRCFADRLVQAAEYATTDQESYQVTWVLAHLAAMYRNCIINLEINGPGTSIMQELKRVKAVLRTQVAEQGEPQAPKDFNDALSAARWYMYHRPDSMGSGYAYGFNTTMSNTMTIMDQLRNSYATRQLVVRSAPLLQEMQTIVQEGGSIMGYGRQKDDRVFAAAFAHKAWLEWRQPALLANRQFYALAMEAEAKGQEPTVGETLVGNIVHSHFARSARGRQMAAEAARFQRRYP